jgi:hypothetical protein
MDRRKQQFPPLRYAPVGGCDFIGFSRFWKYLKLFVFSCGFFAKIIKSQTLGMTILLQGIKKRSDEWLLMVPQNCHPEPERSVVEGPAVSRPGLT